MLENKQRELREKLKYMLRVLDDKVEDESKLSVVMSILFYRFLSENTQDFDSLGDLSEEDFKTIFFSIFQFEYTSNNPFLTRELYRDLPACLLSENELSFKFKQAGFDVLGSAYEFLRSKVKNNAGKETGEYYTQQSVASLLSRIVTIDNKDIVSCYDPSCGSGALLLNMANKTRAKEFYGQEINEYTANLAKISLFLTLGKTKKYIIRNADTLQNPKFINQSKFDAVVSNPPYGLKWDGVDMFNTGCGFIPRRIMPPNENSEYAFVLHSLEVMADHGTAAIVLPHGVLYRESETHIRRYLIDENNYLDAVIGLPKKTFFGTKIETCVLVFKKNRSDKSVLFIDAKDEFVKNRRLNKLEKPAILRIISNLKSRNQYKKYSSLVSHSSLSKNDYNLNIRRHVDTTQPMQKFCLHELNSDMKKFSTGDILNIKDGTDKMKENKKWLESLKERYANWMFSDKFTLYKDDVCWVNKRIDEVFTGKSSLGLGVSDVTSSGKNECITYGQLRSVYSQVIDIDPCDVISKTNSESGIKSKTGDLLIANVAQEGSIDKITKATLINQENILLGMHIVVLRAKIEIDPLFFVYYINNFLRRDLYRYIQGSTVAHLYFSHYKHVMMRIPKDVEQQRKISNYLASIDEHIEWLNLKILKRNGKKNS